MGEKKEIQNAERRRKSPGLASTNAVSPIVAGKALLGNIDDAGYTTGHDTDGGQSSSGKKRPKLKKRSKTSGPGATDVGYDTDEGSMSSSQQRSLGKAKGKSSRFFMLGNKDKSGLEPEMSSPNPEPTSPAPVFRTPIAARFARTLGNLDAPSVVEPPSRSWAPLVPSPSHVSPQREPRKPEPLTDTSVSPIKRRGIHFGSDTDHSGSRSPSMFSFSRSGSSSSSLTSHSHAGSKVPLISLPITRSSSPPPQSPPQPRTSSLNKAGTKHVPDPLSLSTQSANLLGDSPIGSPFVLSTPFSLPSEPSPSKKSFFNRTVEDLVKPKTRQNKDIALHSASASNLASSSDMSLQRTRSPPALAVVIPQQRVARRAPRSDEPPLNTYSYYELPPPSPPLDKPVPPLPAMPSREPSVASSPKRKSRPQRMMSPSTSRPTSPIGRSGATSPVGIPLRGRESPFPSRPLLSPSTVAPTSRMTIGHVPGLEVRRTMSTTRYRDPQRPSPPVGEGRRSVAPQTYRPPNRSRPSGYFSDGPAAAPATSNNFHRAKHGRDNQRAPTSPLERYGLRFEAGSLVLDGESDDEGRGFGYDQDVDDDIRAVANLYNAGSRRAHRDEPPGGQSISYAAMADRSLDESKPAPPNGYPVSHYDSDDQSHYPDDEVKAAGDRSTVYSIISYYSSGNLSLAESRSSFMDSNKSEQSRERFVRRIEAMYDANGRELPPRDFIPPVPKLPQGLVTNGIRSGGWF